MSMSTHAVLLFGAELRLPPDEANALWESMHRSGEPLSVEMETFGNELRAWADGNARALLYVEASYRSIRSGGHMDLDAVWSDAGLRAKYEATFAAFCAEHGLSIKPSWRMAAVFF